MDVVFCNPITGKIECMPVAMIGAYLPYQGDLDLSKCAELAAVRDEVAAANLFASIPDAMVLSMQLDATESARLAIEPPSLR